MARRRQSKRQGIGLIITGILFMLAQVFIYFYSIKGSAAYYSSTTARLGTLVGDLVAAAAFLGYWLAGILGAIALIIGLLSYVDAIKTFHKMTPKEMACCALLAALSVVFARLLAYAPSPTVRWSLDKFPLFLAGMFFGPMTGALTGFAADCVGCMFSPFGINPLFSIPAILYGFAGGIFRRLIARKHSIWWVSVGYFIPVLFGSVLYQSAALALVYNPTTFMASFAYNLSLRSVQFIIVAPLEITAIYLLLHTKVFEHAGIWPPAPKKKKDAGKLAPLSADEVVEYIHSITWLGSKPGLERTQALLQRMGNPEKKLKFVHIAGTNGKGSTAAMTASILRKAGYKVGLFTSPCIYKFNERIQVNGVHISDEDLAAVTNSVRPLAAAMADHPTEFELVSCIGFEYFARQDCDIVVLEVGMGGSWDSTNVIDVPEVAVITNIGLDHTDYLGNTLEEIAQTKAGIIKEGGDAVLYPGEPAVESVIETICQDRNVNLRKADFDSLQLLDHSLKGQTFTYKGKTYQMPLLGVHQLHNAAMVLTIVETLIEKGYKISEENIFEGIRDVTWPGRFDIAREDPLFIIDGGHNPQCIEALAENIKDYLADRKVIALTGVLADKDYAKMYTPIMPFIQEFVCITPPNPRRLDASLLAQYLMEVGAVATACDEIPKGVKTAMEKAGQDGVVLCFGSLYSIGDIRTALDQQS